MENCGTHEFCVIRTGRTDVEAKVRVETIDGSAVETEDYEAINEILTFAPGEEEKKIGVNIVDDNQVHIFALLSISFEFPPFLLEICTFK